MGEDSKDNGEEVVSQPGGEKADFHPQPATTKSFLEGIDRLRGGRTFSDKIDRERNNMDDRRAQIYQPIKAEEPYLRVLLRKLGLSK